MLLNVERFRQRLLCACSRGFDSDCVGYAQICVQ
jgi:hypothetical protein